MKPRRPIDPVDEILAGGRLPGSAYDSIFERVIEGTTEKKAKQPDPPRRFRRWLAWTLLPAGALAGAWLLWARPASGPGHDGFTTKGTAPPDAGIQLACSSSSGPRCRPGDTMMFVVNPSVSAGFLGAFAEPIRPGAPDQGGDRIWYFPDSAGQSPLVRPAPATGVLGSGITIGPEHPPGRYRVTLLLANRPLTRDEIDRPPANTIVARSSRTLEVAPDPAVADTRDSDRGQ